MQVESAKDYMKEHEIDWWLLYDFQGSNPVFWEIVGARLSTTRRCYLFISPEFDRTYLAHFVDQGLFNNREGKLVLYTSREDMIRKLSELLKRNSRVAMEYSPECEIPYVSRVDAGTFQLIKNMGIEIVSSADLLQYLVALWDEHDLHTHVTASQKVSRIKDEAFEFIGSCLRQKSRVTEHDVQEFIVRRFHEEKLVTVDRPIVAVNENSGDPHYEPNSSVHKNISVRDRILIDLWARTDEERSIYADITWVAYAGYTVPQEYQKVFDIVKTARDLAIEYLKDGFRKNVSIQGWQVDQVARDYIGRQGYGKYFTHRTGHSIGCEQLHGNGVNIDGYETKDTRLITPGAGFSIEPGIYLQEFGVRSEVDIFVSPQGPVVTTPIQQEIITIVC